MAHSEAVTTIYHGTTFIPPYIMAHVMTPTPHWAMIHNPDYNPNTVSIWVVLLAIVVVAVVGFLIAWWLASV